jgi:hypothetical protein
MSLNLGEIARWMKETSWQLNFYRESRSPSETPK